MVDFKKRITDLSIIAFARLGLKKLSLLWCIHHSPIAVILRPKICVQPFSTHYTVFVDRFFLLYFIKLSEK